MFIASFPAGPWQTNCYLVAPGDQGPCVVIDPGVGALGPVHDLVAEHGLEPRGVLLTHGHIDHLYSAVDVCAAYDVGCWIHPGDRARLTDPYEIAGAREVVEQELGHARDFSGREPAVVHEVADREPITLAGLAFEPLHAPGHTPGSTLYRIAPQEPETRSLVFTGDVVFAGSIGRVDLPGGDAATMRETLRTVVLELADDTVLLPGHGGQTTMSRERASNPYLSAQGLTSF
ncbi:MBL fold metallo-hydrolase [Raineyella fluvialis]|uniref:MBL fold metallo-hydrolase n=1 Tax=Raineyella fluvialis TaxID=2662261 RepID=A0A5Q2FIP2_9ACTN|nr:MBL fold metallo-hydrolase [Raineyella fluvialis]QGF24515.1 MBL fold metallo-hydrolase [Raineyella fluvialis]